MIYEAVLYQGMTIDLSTLRKKCTCTETRARGLKQMTICINHSHNELYIQWAVFTADLSRLPASHFNKHIKLTLWWIWQLYTVKSSQMKSIFFYFTNAESTFFFFFYVLIAAEEKPRGNILYLTLWKYHTDCRIQGANVVVSFTICNRPGKWT